MRQRFVARYAPREGPGLEIGPSFNPLARNADGFRVDILDHADAPALRAKYRDAGIRVDNIEDVDFVWRGEPLSEMVGRRDW